VRLVHGHGREPALEQVACPASTRVDEIGLALMCFPHRTAHRIRPLRGEDVRPDLDSRFTSLLGQQVAIDLVVPILEKYGFPPVSALGYVMRKAGNHHASKARHHGKLPEKKERGDRYAVGAPSKSWRDPAGASPAQVRRSSRLVVSVAWWKATTTAKRTQQLCGVGY
jgi:hypothetical protein